MGTVKGEEREAIKDALMDHYELEEGDVEKLVAEATRRTPKPSISTALPRR